MYKYLNNKEKIHEKKPYCLQHAVSCKKMIQVLIKRLQLNWKKTRTEIMKEKKGIKYSNLTAVFIRLFSSLSFQDETNPAGAKKQLI